MFLVQVISLHLQETTHYCCDITLTSRCAVPTVHILVQYQYRTLYVFSMHVFMVAGWSEQISVGVA
jgi:hypothetical protein